MISAERRGNTIIPRKISTERLLALGFETWQDTRYRQPKPIYMEGLNSCVSCVAGNVLWMTGKADQDPNIADIDNMLGRNPKTRLVNLANAYEFYLKQGLQLKVFEEEGSEESEAAFSNRIAPYKAQYTQEFKTPALEDLTNLLEDGYLVEAGIDEGEAQHAILLYKLPKSHPYDYGVYNPRFKPQVWPPNGYGGRFPEDPLFDEFNGGKDFADWITFESCWVPESGIAGIKRGFVDQSLKGSV